MSLPSNLERIRNLINEYPDNLFVTVPTGTLEDGLRDADMHGYTRGHCAGRAAGKKEGHVDGHIASHIEGFKKARVEYSPQVAAAYEKGYREANVNAVQIYENGRLAGRDESLVPALEKEYNRAYAKGHAQGKKDTEITISAECLKSFDRGRISGASAERQAAKAEAEQAKTPNAGQGYIGFGSKGDTSNATYYPMGASDTAKTFTGSLPSDLEKIADLRAAVAELEKKNGNQAKTVRERGEKIADLEKNMQTLAKQYDVQGLAVREWWRRNQELACQVEELTRQKEVQASATSFTQRAIDAANLRINELKGALLQVDNHAQRLVNIAKITKQEFDRP